MRAKQDPSIGNHGVDPSLRPGGGSAGGKTAERMVGIVLGVDRAAGTLTLGVVRERSLRCTTDPALLREVQIGGPVQVVVEGTTVRTLRCL